MDFIKPFEKGERLTFSLHKRKSCKKKCANVPLDRCLRAPDVSSDCTCGDRRANGSPEVSFYHASTFCAGAVRLRDFCIPHLGILSRQARQKKMNFVYLKKISKKSLIGSEISCWGCLSSRQRIMREAQAYGLMEFPERHINGATPLRRAKYPRLRGLLRRVYVLSLPNPKAIDLQGRLLLL